MINLIRKIMGIIEVLLLGIYKSLGTICSGYYGYLKKDKCKKKIFIMGNGPSLNKVDISKIIDRKTDIVCVNFFPTKNADFWKIKPKYLCLIDNALFSDNEKWNVQKQELINTLEKVDWDMIILSLFKRELPVVNNHISYRWISNKSLTKEALPGFRHFLYSKWLVNCGAQNVVIPAVYYFINRKVKKIYLAGVDMSGFKSLFVDKDNNILIEIPHFYGKEKMQHPDETMFKKGEFYKMLECYVKTFEQFYYLKRYADSQRVEIINLTIDSYIDVFEKSSEYLIDLN